MEKDQSKDYLDYKVKANWLDLGVTTFSSLIRFKALNRGDSF
jgi:hypothetical protein